MGIRFKPDPVYEANSCSSFKLFHRIIKAVNYLCGGSCFWHFFTSRCHKLKETYLTRYLKDNGR